MGCLMLRRVVTLIGTGWAVICLVIFARTRDVSSATGSVLLRPPFSGTYPLTSFFDHRYPNYVKDNEITIYTGESVTNCSPHCYHGHPGYDWGMSEGTPVLAAADGTVRETFESAVLYGNSIVLEHENGYRTLYAHLREISPFNVVIGQRVNAGNVIGWSGTTGNSEGPHLHFGVYRGLFTRQTNDERNATDPLGWRGSYPDPLLNYPATGQGHTASCLWRSHDQDPISCADTIVEDGAQGSVMHGAWNVNQVGNGYHMFYRHNTAPNDYTVSAVWNATLTLKGVYQVYAFIPEALHSTQHVTYTIWNGDSQQSQVVNQSAYTNTWVSLGTHTFPSGQAQVGMFAHTGEPVDTTWVAADAVKFRSYFTFLPTVLKNYCTPHYGDLITNGTFSTGDSTGWTTYRSNGPDPIVQLYAGSDHAALLGRYNSNQDQIYQVACMPASSSYAQPIFGWWLSTDETEPDPYDYLYVRIRDADGNLLNTLKTVTNLDEQPYWRWEAFDLRSYADQTVWISFEAANDGSFPTNFWIDNVSLIVLQ